MYTIVIIYIYGEVYIIKSNDMAHTRSNRVIHIDSLFRFFHAFPFKIVDAYVPEKNPKRNREVYYNEGNYARVDNKRSCNN